MLALVFILASRCVFCHFRQICLFGLRWKNAFFETGAKDTFALDGFDHWTRLTFNCIDSSLRGFLLAVGYYINPSVVSRWVLKLGHFAGVLWLIDLPFITWLSRLIICNMYSWGHVKWIVCLACCLHAMAVIEVLVTAEKVFVKGVLPSLFQLIDVCAFVNLHKGVLC